MSDRHKTGAIDPPNTHQIQASKTPLERPAPARLRDSALGGLWFYIVGLWVLDLGIKYGVSQHFYLGERMNILPVFDFILLHNTGAAFSFLADQGGWQRWFFSVIGVAVSVWLVIWLRQIYKHPILISLSLAAILSGALGNLSERIVNGYVVDYLLFYWSSYYFPAFNLADSLISIGAVGLLVEAVCSYAKVEKGVQGKQSGR